MRNRTGDDWSDHIRARLAALGLQPEREAEIVEELSQHLDDRYQELRLNSLTEDDARRMALDELLAVHALRDGMHALRQAHAVPRQSPRSRPSLIEGFWQDVRHGLRALRKERMFAAAAALTLALGIGGTTAIFSVVNGILIKPLPYENPDALVRIVHSIGGIRQAYFSDPIYRAYVESSQAFADVGVWRPAATATLTGLGDPEEVRSLTANRGVLTTLGVAPELGRWFSAAEDAPGAPGTVMLSHGYWQRKFGGDPGVLSRTLTIDGRSHQIVGVMPASFRFGDEFEIVTPLRLNPAAPLPVFYLLGVARLKPGVTLAQASADVPRILHAWFEQAKTPPEIRARWSPALRSLKEDVVGNVGETLWVLMGAIALVLLMACANVATLLLVRGESRRRELAIRAALGARWTRIARQLLVEMMMLAVLGGAAGLALAYAAVRLLVLGAPSNLPRVSEIAIDPTVLAFAVVVSVLSALLFAAVPILKHARPRVDALSASGLGLTRERQRLQQGLVTAQIAFALMLLVGAGLMIRSFHALRSVSPGFDSPETLQMFAISIGPAIAPEAERVTRMQQEMVEKITALPGVSSVAYASRMPMGTDRASAALTVKGRRDDGRTPPNRHVKLVSPGLFRTQGTPIVAGRDFTWTDIYGSRDIAVASESLARELWGSPQAAIGQFIREYYDNGSPWREVIGVVGDVHDDGVQQDAPTTVYFPARPVQRAFGIGGIVPRRVTLAVRTPRAGTPDLFDEIRAAVRSVSAAIPLADVRTLDEVYFRSIARTSFTLGTLAAAALIALLLGMCGIYGVIAYAVSRRRREIGIRLALGAPIPAVRRLFVRRGVILGSIGLAAGLCGALAATRLMRSVLFGVTPLDPMTFLVMPVVLAAAAVLASYLPARAASTIDPLETMRSE